MVRRRMSCKIDGLVDLILHLAALELAFCILWVYIYRHGCQMHGILVDF